MKTNGNRIKNQMAKLLFIILPLMTGTISCQKDPQIDLDITNFQWELISIIDNKQKHEKPKSDTHLLDLYVLIFENDSVFRLDFSTTRGMGQYSIIDNGQIDIVSFGPTTFIALSDFDEKLLSAFKKLTSFTIKGETLLFRGNNTEIEFRRK